MRRGRKTRGMPGQMRRNALRDVWRLGRSGPVEVVALSGESIVGIWNSMKEGLKAHQHGAGISSD